MNLKHKVIRFIEQPTGILDLAQGISPMYTNYFMNVKKFSAVLVTYIDIGANVGGVIKAAKKVFKIKNIYAFEPIRENCEKIKNAHPEVKVYNVGLWDTKTTKPFFYVKNHDIESSFLRPMKVEDKNVEMRQIQLKRFDSLALPIERPCFVKIDTEGSEYFILKGFGEQLHHIDFVQIEQTHSYEDNFENKQKNMLSKCIELLETYKFIGFIQLNTTYRTDGYPDKSDLLFFRDKNPKI